MKADSPALLYCNGAAEVRSHNPLNGVAQLPIYTDSNTFSDGTSRGKLGPS